MTTNAAWLLNPGQTRAMTRQMPITPMTPIDALTSRSGVIPGGTPFLLTGSGMTGSVAVGRAYIQGTTAQGAYPAAITSAEPITVANGHATLPRIDSIFLIVYDTLFDTSGQTLASVQYVQGTAAASPTAPTTPTNTNAALRLWDIAVPANASAGSPINWGTALTDRRLYTVALGGIATNSVAGAYSGQYRDTSTTAGIERYNGSAWESRLYLGTAGQVVIGSDVNLFRDSANVARTNDSLIVDGDLTVGGIGQIRAAVRTADSTPLASNTTLTNDTQLLLTVAANAKYRLAGLLQLLGPTAADIKLKFTGPTGATLSWVAYAQDATLSGPTGAIQTARLTLADTAVCGTITGSTPVGALLSGILTTSSTAGTLQLQWAQNTSTAGNTYTGIDSFIELLRVA